MGKTRFEKLHCAAHVQAAERIAMLALDQEERGGKPIIYMTKYDLAKEIGLEETTVSAALRLASTSEFLGRYGYTFVLPGNGRSGERYGYVLQHGRSKATSGEASDTLDDTDTKLADHLRGSAAHWRMIGLAHGGNTRVGKAAKQIESILDLAAQSVETVLDHNGL